MILKTITITGADDNTNIEDMLKISRIFPFIEWGILFSISKQGTPRYPSEQWIKRLLNVAFENNMNLSAHLCGELSKRVVAHTFKDGDIRKIFDFLPQNSFMFNRVQLNFNVSTLTPNWTEFKEACAMRTCIIQYNKANKELCDEIIKQGMKVHFLYDGSGGRGVEPKEWMNKVPHYYTGYAGGLNPENFMDWLRKVQATNYPNDVVWFDMESGVRTNDVLDFEKVFSILGKAKLFMQFDGVDSVTKS